MLALLVSHFSLAAIIIVATIDGTLALAGRALTRATSSALLEDRRAAGRQRAAQRRLHRRRRGRAGPGRARRRLARAAGGALPNAASFYLVAWILSPPAVFPAPSRKRAAPRDRVRAGVAYVRANIPLRRVLVAQGLAFVFFSAVPRSR